MEKESRKKSRTVTEQIEDLKKAGERAEAANKNCALIGLKDTFFVKNPNKS